MNFTKSSLSAVVILAVFMAIVLPASSAFAQGPIPPGDTPSYQEVADLTDLIAHAVSVFALLAFSAVAGSTGVEVTKDITRRIAQMKPLKSVAMQGYGTIIALALSAILMIYGYDLNIISNFEIFKTVDPELVKIMETLVLFGSQFLSHKAGLADVSFKAIELPAPK